MAQGFWDIVGADHTPKLKYSDAAPYIDDPSKTAWVGAGALGGTTLGALMGRGFLGRGLSAGLGAGLGAIGGLATSGITTGPRFPHQGEGPREYLPDSNAVVPKLSYPPPSPIKPQGLLSPLYAPIDKASDWISDKTRDTANYLPDFPSGKGLGIMRGAQALTRGLAPSLASMVPETASSVLKTASLPVDAYQGNQIDATPRDVATTAMLGILPAARGLVREARMMREGRELAGSTIGGPYRSPERIGRKELAAAKPQSTTGASLSTNLSSDPNAFTYAIYRDGKRIGDASGYVIGPKAHINWIGAHSMEANTIGISGVKRLREQIRKDFPTAKTFEGTRISGARQGPAARPDARSKQSVYIPSWMLPLLGGSAGLGLMPGVPDAYP